MLSCQLRVSFQIQNHSHIMRNQLITLCNRHWTKNNGLADLIRHHPGPYRGRQLKEIRQTDWSSSLELALPFGDDVSYLLADSGGLGIILGV